MPIQFYSENKIFKLDTASTSYVMQVNKYGYLLHHYYGASIDDCELSDLNFTVRHGSHFPRVEMESETNPFFSKDLHRMEYSCNGCGDFRGSALSILRSAGTNDTDIKYVSHKIYAGKPKIEGQPATYATEDEATTLEILCRDDVSGAEVTLFYTVFEALGAMTRHVSVKNTSDTAMDIQRVLSTCVDFHDARDMDFIHLYGSWGKERRFERVPLIHGTQSVSSKRGASSSMHNPFIALCSQDAIEEYGDVYGFNLVYTGNFLASAEMDADGGARVLMGINPENFTWHLEPNESFTTPEAVMVYSNQGLGGMSRIYHKLYRNNLCRGEWKNKRRPILINNWEATYFDFNEEKLYDIAKTAAELGIEMLVMDDGWFSTRNDTKSGLGDWFVNEEKLKGGLGKLTERINALGLKFGIWFEPEMVSKNSDLFRKHPDWALQTPNRDMSIARYQYVLDMGREDVRDYLFDCISKVMDSANIAYIKWDFNRNLTEVGSALLDTGRQQEVFHRYVLGLYELLERILTKYPHLLLEGCASGGGRFDPAWLYYAPQSWTSDDTDAIERLDIQYGTSICYPVSTMGSHVSACPNHQTGRITPLETRGHMAMSGTFGYELDLTKLTDEEKETVKAQCDEYRRYYDLINKGELYRLISPWKDRTRCAWSFVSEDKSEALVTYVVMKSSIYDRHYVRLKGLDENKKYLNEQTGQILSGRTLMNAGICIQDKMKDFTSCILHFTAFD
ncbi:MAG: alpha-galactosidase [Clostridia bacterium]|nr:alpha-galactosidase [Clostridia bacterium]